MSNIKTFGYAFAVTAAGFLSCASPTMAQGVGYVGLTFGYNDAENIDNDDRDYGNSVTVDGAYAFRFGGSNTLVFDASYRSDGFDDVIDELDVEGMAPQYQIGAHYLRDVTSNAKLGGFLSYGVAPHDNLLNEDYKVWLLGVEAIFDVSPQVILFGQLAFGDSIDNPDNSTQDSFGFHRGKVVRAGAIYTGLQNTDISLEFEIGGSKAYEDDDEPGRFYSVALGGQTALGGSNWAATYGVRYAGFAAREDGDAIDEMTASIGFRYIFGANKPSDIARAGIIGLPYTPLRASAWTPAMD